MNKRWAIVFHLVAALNFAAALGAGFALWTAWDGKQHPTPAFLAPVLAWDLDQVDLYSLLACAIVGATSLLAYLTSFGARDTRRPMAGLWLVGAALAAPIAPILVASSKIESAAVQGVICAALIAAGGALVFPFEYLAFLVSRGLAAGCEKAKLGGLAGRLFRLARKFNPNDPGLMEREAMAEYERGAFERAMPILESLTEGGTGGPRTAMEMLETCYRMSSLWEKDADLLERLLRNHPKNPVLLRRFAEASEKIGRWEQAMQAREALLEPNNRRQLHELARLALRVNDRKKALAYTRNSRDLDTPPYQTSLGLYEALIKADPDSPEAMEDLADIYVKTGAPGEAARLWGAILEKHPTRPRPLQELAERCRMTGDLPEEEKYLRRLGALPVPTEEIWLRLADNLTAQRRPEDAEAALRQGMAGHPDEPRFPWALCHQRLARGDIDEAARLLEILESRNIESDKTRVTSMRRRVEAMKTQRELEGLRTLVEATPDDLEARLRLADRLASVGDLVGARGEMGAMLQRRPETRPAIMAHLDEMIASAEQKYLLLDFKADLDFQDRNYAAALATYETMAAQSMHGPTALRQGCERVLKAAPEYQPALEKLGRLLIDAGDWEEAATTLLRLESVAGESPAVARSLFEVLTQLGRLADAEPRGKLLLRSEPANLELRIRLAEACEAMEGYKEGLNILGETPESQRADVRVRRLMERLDIKRKRKRMAELSAQLQSGQDSAPANYELGGLHQEFQEFDDAITRFQRASRDEGLRDMSKAHMAYCLTRREMYDLAEETLNDVRLSGEDGASQEEIKQLIYESARLFEEKALGRRALAFYKAIFRVDAAFRDVVARISRYGG